MATVNDRVVGGRYVLRDILGTGGMGTVYRAEDLDRHCAVALKLLHRRAGCAPRRPVSEQLAGAIRHPNVVAVRDAGELSDGTPFLVMELVRGITLDELVHAEGPLALRRAAAIVGQILSGLQALHDSGFVHGDVKSRNVLIDAAGGDRVTLIDLGLAHDRDRCLPTERIASGTPEYMAPEVVRGDGAIARSDVYAAGVVMYQLLTGTTPFEGGPAHEILRRQLDEVVVPPSLRCPDRVIPPALEAAVMAALAKDPAARPASAAALAAALAAATPSTERPPCGDAHRMFSTEAPTLEWRPLEPLRPASVARPASPRPRGIAAAPSGGVGRRAEHASRGTIAPCRRSTATRTRSAWSTRRRR